MISGCKMAYLSPVSLGSGETIGNEEHELLISRDVKCHEVK